MINGFNTVSAQQSKTIDSPFRFHLVTNGSSRFHLVACAFNPLKVVPAVMFVPLMHQLVYLLRPVIIVPFRVDKLVPVITLLTNTVYRSFLIREACFWCRWWLTQKPRTGQYVEKKRLWSTQQHLYHTPLPKSQERKDCRSRRWCRTTIGRIFLCSRAVTHMNSQKFWQMPSVSNQTKFQCKVGMWARRGLDEELLTMDGLGEGESITFQGMGHSQKYLDSTSWTWWIKRKRGQEVW